MIRQRPTALWYTNYESKPCIEPWPFSIPYKYWLWLPNELRTWIRHYHGILFTDLPDHGVLIGARHSNGGQLFEYIRAFEDELNEHVGRS
jgi:hypothetical protein